ncbi:MAG TPA: hypothetical protein PK435_15305 [Thermoanaerobaculaceae bacterium]|nr:hypothetical protein [Thermoanaerobaculaceae bacterium]
MMPPLLTLTIVLLAAIGPTPPQPEAAAQAAYEPGPDDVVQVGDWPAIGKWMIDRHMRPAEWLGARVQGKGMREPINVVLVDPAARSADEALARVRQACRAAGYRSREGHSGGYRGYLGGVLFSQQPATAGHAFSNEPFEFHNKHGRIFGPFPLKEGWIFIAALSRERFDPFTKTEHVFVSFNQARDDFARKLEGATGFAIAGHVELGNALAENPSLTTGDHAGRAVVLKARR